MKGDEECDSSQEEGFYKPQLKVVEPKDQPLPLAFEPLKNEAKDLIDYSRPSDFQPRVLTISPQIYKTTQAINGPGDTEQQQLIPIALQKTKKCKYLSLKEKYENNEYYRLVYSKLQLPIDFNGYIFSLNHTTDHNPADYQQVHLQKQNHNIFDSKFESGNLLYAYECLDSKQNEYDLILQNDTNTRGYNKWFFFSYKNQGRKCVRFNIVNLIKKHQLFQDGVRPVGISVKNQVKGWHSIGRNIDYQKSYVSRQIANNPPLYKHYYTLSFTVDFLQLNDTYFIALNYPYTYTKMINFIDQISLKVSKNIKLGKEIICHSISNNPLPVIRIKHLQYTEGGKKILIMGRQHPGETVGSFVLQGFLSQIINQQKLLKHYELIVIPMVNPDGVIYGNFRTNLAGFDLNRQWSQPDRWMHPQIYAIQKFLDSLQNIAFVIDFHGHSKKYNSFIFACSGEQVFPFRVFPYLFSTVSSYFSIKDCTYSLTSDKQRTARIKLYKQLNKVEIFTLETSFFGYEQQNGKKFRWKINQLFEIGEAAAESVKIYLLKKKQLLHIQKQVREKQYLFQQWSRQIRGDLESESNPSQDQLTALQRKQKVIAPKENKRVKIKGKKKGQKNLKILVPSPSKDKHKYITDASISPIAIVQEDQCNAEIIIRKKIESVKVIPIKDRKIKSKKVEKMVSIVSPVPPKSYQTKVKLQSAPCQEFEQPRLKERAVIASANTDRKVEKQQSKNITISSNLFNKPSYFNQLQDRLLKLQNTNNKKHNKSYSIEANTIKYDKNPFNKKDIATDILQKIVTADEDKRKDTKIQTFKKQRQRIINLRENKIINTSARRSQAEMKKNLQQEINTRTLALRNCQLKMREIALDQPILNISYQLDYIPKALESKTEKFPSLKIERNQEF